MSDNVGSYLRSVRLALGLSLRAVQERTHGNVKNGYLSQIENGDIKSPSPTILHDLAQAYDIDYADVLSRAGHPIPSTSTRSPRIPAAIAGSIPQSALADLDEREQSEVLDFLAFLKSRRVSATKR